MAIFFPYFYFSRKTEQAERPLLPFACTIDMNSKAITIYNIMIFVFYHCAPLITITVLSSLIMKSLRRVNPVIQGNDQSNARRREQNKRIMNVLITINIFFFICWTPGHVVVFRMEFPNSVKGNILEVLFIVCYIFLALVSTAVNPVILFSFSSNYRQALRNCLRVAVSKRRSCFKKEQAAREENVGLPELPVQ